MVERGVELLDDRIIKDYYVEEIIYGNGRCTYIGIIILDHPRFSWTNYFRKDIKYGVTPDRAIRELSSIREPSGHLEHNTPDSAMSAIHNALSWEVNRKEVAPNSTIVYKNRVVW